MVKIHWHLFYIRLTASLLLGRLQVRYICNDLLVIFSVAHSSLRREFIDRFQDIMISTNDFTPMK